MTMYRLISMVKFVNNNGTDFQSKLGFQFTNKVYTQSIQSDPFLSSYF
jgi:hypothetical protein